MTVDEQRMRLDERLGRKQLTQKFFWGRHGGVGGGNDYEKHWADITLRFLIEEMMDRELKLAFNKDHIPYEPDLLPEPISDASESWVDKFMRLIGGKNVRKIASVNDVHKTDIT